MNTKTEIIHLIGSYYTNADYIKEFPGCLIHLSSNKLEQCFNIIRYEGYKDVFGWHS